MPGVEAFPLEQGGRAIEDVRSADHMRQASALLSHRLTGSRVVGIVDAKAFPKERNYPRLGHPSWALRFIISKMKRQH
jgi:hypothetical protein